MAGGYTHTGSFYRLDVRVVGVESPLKESLRTFSGVAKSTVCICLLYKKYKIQQVALELTLPEVKMH